MKWIDLGRKKYQVVWDLQERLRQARLKNKIDNLILFVEHPAVITIGKQKDSDLDFKVSPSRLQKQGIEVVASNRGGRLTYHGPGQRVIYCVVELKSLGVSIKQFVDQLEQVCLEVLARYDLSGSLQEGTPGVWVGKNKIAFIGLHVSQGVTIHGISFNISRDLKAWENIVPCGLATTGITALGLLLNKEPAWAEVRATFLSAFEKIFSQEISWMEEKVAVDSSTDCGSSLTAGISSKLADSSGSDFK